MTTPMRPDKPFHRSPHLHAVLAALVLIVFSGCASDPSQAIPKIDSTQKPTTSITSTSVVDTEADCEDNARDDLQKRVSAQINALSRGAFDDAREFASPSFRQNVDPSAFRAMIESGFPFLLNGNPVAFGRCRIIDGTATIEVRFAEGTPVTLVYFLISWEDQWWIDAASPAVNSLTDKVETS